MKKYVNVFHLLMKNLKNKLERLYNEHSNVHCLDSAASAIPTAFHSKGQG